MKISELTGSSSGPYQQWGNNVRTHRQVADAATHGANLLYPNQLGFVSGRDAGRVATHIANVESDNGKQYRKDVTRLLTTLLHSWSNATGHLSVMTGNEVTSGAFKNNTGGNPIATYVEYDFAPFVQAAWNVSLNIHITLGSIGNGSSQRNQRFLADLLDYVVVGKYAPLLTGKRVKDLISGINVHYIMGKGSQDDYISDLDIVMAHGLPLIVGEELGRKITSGDFGGGTAIRVLGRLLHYATLRNLTPEQLRILFWATAAYGNVPDSTANAAMTYLTDFIGKDTNLKEVVVLDEGYVFGVGRKRFAILIGDVVYQPGRKWRTKDTIIYVPPTTNKLPITLVFFRKKKRSRSRKTKS